MAEANNPKPILDDNEILKRVDATNKFLENATDAELAFASHAASLSTPVIKFDGATERYGNTYHTSEYIKQRIAACREAYENSGIIGNAIDLMVDFALEGFDIVHPNSVIQNFYKAWADRVHLELIAGQILKSYFRDGNVPILSFRGRIKAREFNKLKKAVANKSEGANLFLEENDDGAKIIPYAYHILDVLNIEKRGSELLGNVVYEYRISTEDLSPLREPKTIKDNTAIEQLKTAIGDDGFTHLSETGHLKINPNRLIMLYYKKDDYRAWANPMFWRIISDVQFKKLLRDMDISVCESVMNTLTIIGLGDTKSGFPATGDMFKKIASLLKTPTKSKTIIWNDLIKIIAEYPPIDKILGKAKYDQVDADIRAGLGIAEVVLNGQGNNYANSFLSVKTLLERLESGRNHLLAWLEMEVRNVAKAMGFKQPAWFKMHHMSLRDENAEKQLMLELVDRGMVSYETCVERFGENFQIEIERMKQEDNFRRKNEKRFPYTLIKTGKYGPMIQDGPIPIFELLDSETIEETMIRKNGKSMPTQQGGQGEKGGRPAGRKTPQQKKETPRNKPKGQETQANLDNEDLVKESNLIKAEDIFNGIFKIISRSFIKAKKVDFFNELDDKSQKMTFKIISYIIERFKDPEEVNKDRVQEALKSRPFELQDNNKPIVADVYDKLVDRFISQNNSYPGIEESKQAIISSLAVLLN